MFPAMVRAILIAALLLASPASGADVIPGPVPAVVERVVDGDTLAVRALIWPGHEVRVLVRLDAIDAPEMRGPDCAAEFDQAVAARDALSAAAGETVTLHDVHFGKYAGRVVARVENAAGQDLGATLQAEGLAIGADAEKRWCIALLEEHRR